MHGTKRFAQKSGRKKKAMPENMQRISELAAKAREHGKSYGFYVAEIKV